MHTRATNRLSVLALAISGALLTSIPSVSGASGNGIEPSRVLQSSEISQTAHARHAVDLRQELAASGLRFGDPIFIQIFKESRELDLYVLGDDGFELFRTFPICRVSGFLGPKRHEGDHQAPEGFYRVTTEWMNPNSNFHLSFNIGYPNSLDASLQRTGGNIMVHGGCVSQGCFAMTNGLMEKIYTLAEAALLSGQDGFDVHVFPFRMNEDNMDRHQYSRWFDFWQDLEPGYRYFAEHRFPPTVAADGDRYIFFAHNQPPEVFGGGHPELSDQ